MVFVRMGGEEVERESESFVLDFLSLFSLSLSLLKLGGGGHRDGCPKQKWGLEDRSQDAVVQLKTKKKKKKSDSHRLPVRVPPPPQVQVPGGSQNRAVACGRGRGQRAAPGPLGLDRRRVVARGPSASLPPLCFFRFLLLNLSLFLP